MPTLVIGVPSSKAPPARDFDTVLKLKIGEAFTANDASQLTRTSNWNVIVLDKEGRRRADGKLVRLESVPTDPRYPPGSGRTRFGVHVDELVRVAYDAPLPPLAQKPRLTKNGSPWLNHDGTALLW